ncbi:MAG TPA: hypothetical protein PK530_10435 [Anaerolineales bacterium]|nr:hypothetical protein [Anaerolineales bacterium]
MFKSPSFRLFLISFLTLYFELVCIRWLTSYVLYLGYFTNFVLMGALLGIGAGALLAGRKPRLIQWLPPLMFVFFSLILITRAQVQAGTENFIYFTNEIAFLPLPSYVLLPLIFVSVMAMFTLISMELGTLINAFVPLKAYNINILGSLAGIATFTLFSFLSFPAWVWFLVAALLLAPFLTVAGKFGRSALFLVGMVSVIAAGDFAYQAIWSPYSRLGLFERTDTQSIEVNPNTATPTGDIYNLTANGVSHQLFATLEQNPPFYHLPYTAFAAPQPLDDVLIIGAGGGNDVAFALAYGAKQVDAVEIDPLIPRLGKKFHPEHPYDDPRVTLTINDARAYLEQTDKKYDLIIFALPDSLVLATSSSNIRLESFLFTKESFQSVKDHLKPNGLFVLYNYYRYDWLVDKIAFMLTEVFGEPPVTQRYDDPLSQYTALATIFAGPRARLIDTSQPGFAQATPSQFTPSTDNWPFLYLREPSLPSFYSGTLLIILAFSFFYIRRVAPVGAISKHGLPFFFMGAAFTLLEVKSIVQFLLLFGATWMVNSLVFFAILLVVLVANTLAARFQFRTWVLYGLLFLMLALNLFIPLKTFLFDNLALRYLTATLFLFSPVFFANLIYSNAFRDTEKANIAYGANLLGTMVGGATEYLSLLTGYQNLAILAGIFYFLAFFFFTRMKRQPSQDT